MKTLVAKLPIFTFVALMFVLCLSGIFLPFNPVALCGCFIYFLILIVISQVSLEVLILATVYAIAFISCVYWCLHTSNVKKAYRLFMLICAFDFIFHTIVVSLMVTFDINVINSIVAKIIFFFATVVWYRLKISMDSKFTEKLYSLSSKSVYNCLKYGAIGIVLFKVIGTLIYSITLRFFMYPYTVVSVIATSFVSYENNFSILQDVFSCFINIIVLINLISIVFVLKKRKIEWLFWLTYIIISVSDFVSSHYMNIYQEYIKTISVVLSFVFLVVGVFAAIVWKIELNKSKTKVEQCN